MIRPLDESSPINTYKNVGTFFSRKLIKVFALNNVKVISITLEFVKNIQTWVLSFRYVIFRLPEPECGCLLILIVLI